MEFLIVAVFVLGYLFIALEHPIKINKTATALVTGVLCWTLFVISEPSSNLLQSEHYTKFISELGSHVKDAGLLSAKQIHTE